MNYSNNCKQNSNRKAKNMIRNHYVNGKNYSTKTTMLSDNWQDVMFYEVSDDGHARHIGTYACNERHLSPEEYDSYIAGKWGTKVMNQRTAPKPLWARLKG